MEENITAAATAEPRGIKVGAEGKTMLQGSAKWAKFIAIASLIYLAFGILAVLFWLIAVLAGGLSPYDMYPAMGAMSGSFGIVMSVIMVFVLAIYVAGIYASLYLYRFAVKAGAAVASDNEIDMNEALHNLRGCFKLYGIILIVSIAFSIVSVIGMMIFVAVSAI